MERLWALGFKDSRDQGYVPKPYTLNWGVCREYNGVRLEKVAQ